MEEFQRYLERDPGVGYSFSLSDILRAVNSVFHELEPKWGVIPNNWVDIGGLFFIFFSGSPPTETAKYVSTDYATAHVTFFCRDHKGQNIRRIIGRSKEFIRNTQLRDLGIEVASEGETVVVKNVYRDPPWAKGEGSWMVSETGKADEDTPFKVGDRIVEVGGIAVTDLKSFSEAFADETNSAKALNFKVQRGAETVEVTAAAPWKSVLKLAGGLIGVLAAANEELVRNDLLMNFLGFFTIWVILLFTYRSVRCGLYLLAPMLCSNVICNAVMAYQNIGINIHTLPLVTVGIGFGVDYGMYMVSRIIEEIRVRGDIVESTREAMVTTGKAITFTAVTMVVSTSFWIYSNVRFNAEMGLLLAIWMGIGYVGAQTLLPVLLVVMKPAFIMREANKQPERVAATVRRG
jgi:predicted RND superfamily exporter protein